METVTFISHATQSRLRTVVEKVSTIAQHRLDSCKVGRLQINMFCPLHTHTHTHSKKICWGAWQGLSLWAQYSFIMKKNVIIMQLRFWNRSLTVACHLSEANEAPRTETQQNTIKDNYDQISHLPRFNFMSLILYNKYEFFCGGRYPVKEGRVNRTINEYMGLITFE